MKSLGNQPHPDELDEMLRAYAAWEAAADALYAKVLAGQVLDTLSPDQLAEDYARSQALHRNWIETVACTTDLLPGRARSG